MVGLAHGAMRIDLRLNVPVTGQRATIEGIGLDPVEAQPRQAFYFDTLDLALNRAGLLVRARRIHGRRAETVVKLRCLDPSSLDAELRGSEALRLEVDSLLDGFVCSASFKSNCRDRGVLDVVAGAAPLRSLFSAEQCALFDAHAQGLSMDRLATLGPIFLLRAKRRPKGLDRRLSAELWHHPDGARVLELSTKCAPEECAEVSTELRSYLASCGLSASSDEANRTKAALELLSAGLR